MKMVLKIILFSLLLGGILLMSCTPKKATESSWMQNNGRVKALATVSQIGDLVSFIGKERVDVAVLVPADLDPHSYELVKGDGEKLSYADLIFYHGLGLEHGAGLTSFLEASSDAVPLGRAIRDAAGERIIKKQGMSDPHFWMDVSLWKEAIPSIVEQLETFDPEGAPYYRANAQLLEEEMDRLHAYVLGKIGTIPEEKRFLVTSHDAFSYFSRAYLALADEDWEERFEAPEGLAPDGQLSPVDIRRTMDFLKDHGVKVVFPESNVSRDALAKVASVSYEMGYPIRLSASPLYGDSASGLSYFEMMRQNADVLAYELGQ